MQPAYARISTGRNKMEFLARLLALGQGSAPPSVLTRFRTERDIEVSEDLGELDNQGFRSIFTALETSTTAVTVRFLAGSRLDEWCVRQADSGSPGINFMESIRALCRNRGILETVEFVEPLRVDEKLWSFGSALRLEKVINGDATLYDRAAKHPPSPLRSAVDADDAVACAAALRDLEAASGPRWEDYNLAACSDHWRCMAVLLAEAPPSETWAPRFLANAAFEGSLSCVELLLFWGVAVDARNTDWWRQALT